MSSTAAGRTMLGCDFFNITPARGISRRTGNVRANIMTPLCRIYSCPVRFPTGIFHFVSYIRLRWSFSSNSVATSSYMRKHPLERSSRDCIRGYDAASVHNKVNCLQLVISRNPITVNSGSPAWLPGGEAIIYGACSLIHIIRS